MRVETDSVTIRTHYTDLKPRFENMSIPDLHDDPTANNEGGSRLDGGAGGAGGGGGGRPSSADVRVDGRKLSGVLHCYGVPFEALGGGLV